MARKVQIGRGNTASGDDRVAAQVGKVVAGKGAKAAPPPVDPEPGTTTNIRSGNAQVGAQYDTVIVDLHIGRPGR